MSRRPKIYDYFVLVYAPHHIRAVQSGYVPEQILVAEKVLGRKLTPDEDVRHINGDVQDNRPVNLEITSSHADYKTTTLEVGVAPIKRAVHKSFIPCRFQRQCWKEIRAPKAKKYGIYLPYTCSYQVEADIYKCGHFWNYLDKELEKKNTVVSDGGSEN